MISTTNILICAAIPLPSTEARSAGKWRENCEIDKLVGGGGGNRGRMFLLQFSAPSVPQLSNQDGCGAFDFSEEHLIKISSRLWVKDTEAQSPPHPLI